MGGPRAPAGVPPRATARHRVWRWAPYDIPTPDDDETDAEW